MDFFHWVLQSFQLCCCFMYIISRFGDGYTVTIRMSSDGADVTLLQQFMADTFSNSELSEHHQNVLHYQLPAASMTLAQIFSLMEQARALFSIDDYAVSQTTLDQVFNCTSHIQSFTELMC